MVQERLECLIALAFVEDLTMFLLPAGNAIISRHSSRGPWTAKIETSSKPDDTSGPFISFVEKTESRPEGGEPARHRPTQYLLPAGPEDFNWDAVDSKQAVKNVAHQRRLSPPSQIEKPKTLRVGT